MSAISLLVPADSSYTLSAAARSSLSTQARLKFVAVLGQHNAGKSTLLNSLLGQAIFTRYNSSSTLAWEKTTSLIELFLQDDVVYLDTEGTNGADQLPDFPSKLYSIVFTLAHTLVLLTSCAEISQQSVFLQDTLENAFRVATGLKESRKNLLVVFKDTSVPEGVKAKATAAILSCWAKVAETDPFEKYFKIELIQVAFSQETEQYTAESLQPIQTAIANAEPTTTGSQTVVAIELVLNKLQESPESVLPQYLRSLKFEDTMRFVDLFLQQKRAAIEQNVDEADATSRPNAIQQALESYLDKVVLHRGLIEQVTRGVKNECEAIQTRAIELMIQYCLADIEFQYFKLKACAIYDNTLELLSYGIRIKHLKEQFKAKLPPGLVQKAIETKLAKFEAKLLEKLAQKRKSVGLKAVVLSVAAAVGVGAAALAVSGSLALGTAVLTSSTSFGVIGIERTLANWTEVAPVKLKKLQGQMDKVHSNLEMLKEAIEKQNPKLMLELDAVNADCNFAEYDVEYSILRQLGMLS